MVINIIALILASIGTLAAWKESTFKAYHPIVRYLVTPIIAFFVWKYVITGIIAPFKFIIGLF